MSIETLVLAKQTYSFKPIIAINPLPLSLFKLIVVHYILNISDIPEICQTEWFFKPIFLIFIYHERQSIISRIRFLIKFSLLHLHLLNIFLFLLKFLFQSYKSSLSGF